MSKLSFIALGMSDSLRTQTGIPAPKPSCVVAPSPVVPSLAATLSTAKLPDVAPGSGGQKIRYSMSPVFFTLHFPSSEVELEEDGLAENSD